MKTFALVQNGIVVSLEPEFLEVGGGSYGLPDRFHPDILKDCIELRGGQVANVVPGYSYDGERFSAPVTVTPEPVAKDTKESLRAEIARLSADLAALVDRVEELED